MLLNLPVIIFLQHGGGGVVGWLIGARIDPSLQPPTPPPPPPHPTHTHPQYSIPIKNKNKLSIHKYFSFCGWGHLLENKNFHVFSTKRYFTFFYFPQSVIYGIVFLKLSPPPKKKNTKKNTQGKEKKEI